MRACAWEESSGVAPTNATGVDVVVDDDDNDDEDEDVEDEDTDACVGEER